MFRIKICGITTVDDGLMVARAGADAVGLNFYAKSSRHVEVDQAARIVESLGAEVLKVGVFVNASGEDICRIFDQTGLDLVQLHGDEPPEFLARLGGRAVMRAFRIGPGGLEPVNNYLGQCRRLGCLPRMTLLDSHAKGAYGGTGAVADWSVVSGYPAEGWQPPLVLAGGLTAENVSEAISAVRPEAVDTASGVESRPGQKSAPLLKAFIDAAKRGFGSVSP
jgi:phosphoribosylanthranilate isomerase